MFKALCFYKEIFAVSLVQKQNLHRETKSKRFEFVQNLKLFALYSNQNYSMGIDIKVEQIL